MTTDMPDDDNSTMSADDDVTEQEEVETNVAQPEPQVIPKAVVTVAGLVVFVLLGISISKLVDYCYDRRAISDDASDISDYTKELLKAQLMLAFTSKKKKKLNAEEVTLKYAKIWRAKVARNKVRRMREEIQEHGSYRPTSSRPRKQRPKTPSASVYYINEIAPNLPGASRPGSAVRKKMSSVAPMPTDDSQDTRKGASRPISAGLKSRPVSAKSFKFIPRAGKRS